MNSKLSNSVLKKTGLKNSQPIKNLHHGSVPKLWIEHIQFLLPAVAGWERVWRESNPRPYGS